MHNEASQKTEATTETNKLISDFHVNFLCGIVILVGLLAGLFFHNYKTTEEHDSAEDSLAFAPGNNPDWTWWPETNRVQQQTSKQGKTLLRKVDLGDETAVYALVAASHQLITYVKFVVHCTPGKEVNTSGKINDEIIEAKLKCSDTADGVTALYYNKVWPPGEHPEVWRGNISGFDFSASFKDWNLDPLFREEVLVQAR